MKIHIDDTCCEKELKNRPSRSKVAYYWKEKSFEYFGEFIDWEEPSCWACGRFSSFYDKKNENDNVFDSFNVWDNHRYLERCHIIPIAHGGCNCEANLVLLCRDCHKRSPDTKNPYLFMEWVKNRKKIILKELLLELEYYDNHLGLDNMFFFQEHILEFKEYLKSSAITVAGNIPKSSIIACMLEFLRIKTYNNSSIK